VELVLITFATLDCISFNFEQFNRQFLEARASSWIHAIRVNFSANVDLQLWLLAKLGLDHWIRFDMCDALSLSTLLGGNLLLAV